MKDDILDIGSFDEVNAAKEVYAPAYVTQRRIKGYLSFPKPPIPNDRPWSIMASPQMLFRPECFMLWGYDDETIITGMFIGQMTQGAVAASEIPASFFGTAKSYEKLLEDFAKNGISPPNWITWSVSQIGSLITIQGRGKLTNAVMLGTAVF